MTRNFEIGSSRLGPYSAADSACAERNAGKDTKSLRTLSCAGIALRNVRRSIIRCLLFDHCTGDMAQAGCPCVVSGITMFDHQKHEQLLGIMS